MRNLLIGAAVLLCSAQLGSSTLCYTCSMATNDASCTTISNCTGSTPFCGTTFINGVVVNWMNKFCSAACVNGNQNISIISATESCCTSDLCNNQKLGNVNGMINIFGSGVSGMTSSTVLMLVLGLLGCVFAL